jgi:hypothetical protein
MSCGWLAAVARVKRNDAKVKQGSREDRADVWILASKVVRFRGRVQSEKK